jgi:hypothetical protein
LNGDVPAAELMIVPAANVAVCVVPLLTTTTFCCVEVMLQPKVPTAMFWIASACELNDALDPMTP